MSMILSLVACGNSKETGSSETDIENNSTVANESTEKVSEQESVYENNATDISDSKENVENSNPSLELTVEADYVNLPESQGFEFESNGDGTCTLKKIGSCSDKDIVIPEKSPAGDTITMIAEYAFYGAEDINSIVIAGKTMELDQKAFQSCGVGELIISGCTLELGENVFSYCEDFVTITMDSSTLEIGTYSFYDCTSLVNVSIAADSEADNLELVIDDEAFQSCSVQNIVIGRGKVEIGDNAFSYCEDLMSVGKSRVSYRI